MNFHDVFFRQTHLADRDGRVVVCKSATCSKPK